MFDAGWLAWDMLTFAAQSESSCCAIASPFRVIKMARLAWFMLHTTLWRCRDAASIFYASRGGSMKIIPALF